jgi:hypothetical protein
MSAVSAPASEASVNERTPASARCGPSPLRRSRSMPISMPQPSALASTAMAAEKSLVACMACCFLSKRPSCQKYLGGCAAAQHGQTPGNGL